jgi:hypothetical protein
MLNLIQPTKGNASIFGLDSHQDTLVIRSRLGYIPGEVVLYDGMTGHDFLNLIGSFHKDHNVRRLKELQERLDLSRQTRAYSKGMKQKLAIIQAFMNDPELLILDEPVDSGSLAMVLFQALLMVLAIASITLFCSVVFLDPRKSLLVSGLIVGVSYIINFMVPILDPAIEWLRNTSIFYFYQPNEIVESGSLDATAIAVYTVIILVCFFASLVLFQRRDITV